MKTPRKPKPTKWIDVPVMDPRGGLGMARYSREGLAYVAPEAVYLLEWFVRFHAGEERACELQSRIRGAQAISAKAHGEIGPWLASIHKPAGG